MLQLQQILFFRELEFSLEEIKALLARRNFDLLHTLIAHKRALVQKAERIDRLIRTIDHTIQHAKGEMEMPPQQLFEEFSAEKQKQYEQEIRDRYGDEAFEGTTDWNSYTPEQKARIQAESQAIYRDLLALMDRGYADPQVQKVIARWHQHLRYFYEPSLERLMGLAHLYTEHPDFVAMYKKMHPDMPQFLFKAIEYYCAEKTRPH